MTRAGLLLAALAASLACAQAAPMTATPGVSPGFTTQSPAPGPIFNPAPMPNRDVAAPVPKGDKATAELSPALISPPLQQSGVAYPPKSTYGEELDQRTKPTPGVNLKVPLQ